MLLVKIYYVYIVHLRSFDVCTTVSMHSLYFREDFGRKPKWTVWKVDQTMQNLNWREHQSIRVVWGNSYSLLNSSSGCNTCQNQTSRWFSDSFFVVFFFWPDHEFPPPSVVRDKRSPANFLHALISPVIKVQMAVWNWVGLCATLSWCGRIWRVTVLAQGELRDHSTVSSLLHSEASPAGFCVSLCCWLSVMAATVCSNLHTCSRYFLRICRYELMALLQESSKSRRDAI